MKNGSISFYCNIVIFIYSNSLYNFVGEMLHSAPPHCKNEWFAVNIAPKKAPLYTQNYAPPLPPVSAAAVTTTVKLLYTNNFRGIFKRLSMQHNTFRIKRISKMLPQLSPAQISVGKFQLKKPNLNLFAPPPQIS